MRRAILTALLLAGCATQNRSTNVETMVAQYVDGSLAENPGHAREMGLHAYDGKIPELGDASAVRSIERAKAYLEATDDVDLSRLEDPIRLDVQLTRLDAQSTIFALGTLERHKKILSYAGLFDVNSYLVRDYAPLAQRISSLLDHAEAAAQATDVMLATLAPKQVRTHLETAAQIFKGLIVFYENDVATQSKPALDADAKLKARYDQVIPAAIASMHRIEAWIAERTPQATEDYALGEKNFLAMLKANEGIEMTLPELEAMANEDFQRNHDAFVAVAKEIDPEASVEAVFARVSGERVPADQVLETARRQVTELAAFIREHEIVTIPSDQKCTVTETPPFMRWNSAFLDPAGPFEKSQQSFYYISPPDPTWPADVQAQYIPFEGDLLATTIHEVFPGHFLHGLFEQNAPSRASKIYGSYAFTEGWAHYGEQMMFDAGYGARDPALKLGQLSNALLRNCRFIAAIGLHTKGMTVAEAEDLFKNQCFIDPGNAHQQAYRGTFDPGYLSYTLGKLQIMDLREKFFEKRNTQDLKTFHDWLLSFGAAPVALIAQRL